MLTAVELNNLKNKEQACLEVIKQTLEYVVTNDYDQFIHYQIFFQMAAQMKNKIFQKMQFQVQQNDGIQRLFCASALYNGFFLFQSQIFVPKLHFERSILDLQKFDPVQLLMKLSSHENISQKGIKYKGLKKKIKLIFKNQNDVFYASKNKDFKKAYDNLNATLTNNWIESNLFELLLSYNKEPFKFLTNSCTIQANSFEIYQKQEENEQIAADIGYSIGSIYVSMSGYSFRYHKSMGIIQLIIQAILLKQMGYKYWDFGQDMQYKKSLGAVIKNRKESLQIYQKHILDKVQEIDYLQSGALKNIKEIEEFQQCYEFVKDKNTIIKVNRKETDIYKERKQLERSKKVNTWNQEELRLWVKEMFRNVDSLLFNNVSQLNDKAFMENNVKYKKNQKKIGWAYQRLIKLQERIFK